LFAATTRAALGAISSGSFRTAIGSALGGPDSELQADIAVKAASDAAIASEMKMLPAR
jgi:hypothetical protein